ncbi:enoyl-CoA hydratase [Litorimonas taeanensis]|uniref:Enoyl-CoA hydratase n=1 Tax=Litorimonas taeanensis TaxID=568099 RepID=A0A420WMJ8_9PROT|nr:enoyl-CoA hydratase-related protein [Litorimonas taeanensis]RKQ72115.1 enoyl-CoA hydratase [Litorimonas taeanensis]
MSYTCFDVSIENKIAHIVMNRPEKRNSMIAEFWTELPEIIRDIDDNSKARVIVLSSTGPVFSAGIDLGMFSANNGIGGDKNIPTYGAAFQQQVLRLQDSFNAIEDCRIPVLAAIQGGCYGGGVDLITACDMRYGTEDSFITIYEIIVGMTADVGTFPRILNHLPEGLVRELAYTGRKMHANEAHDKGLFNEVYEDHETMLKSVMEIAKDIAEKPPLAVYGCKRAITYGRDHSTKDALENIAIWNMSMLIPSEMMEAMQAKGQKRPGNFSDLPKR